MVEMAGLIEVAIGQVETVEAEDTEGVEEVDIGGLVEEAVVTAEAAGRVWTEMPCKHMHIMISRILAVFCLVHWEAMLLFQFYSMMDHLSINITSTHNNLRQ